MRAGMWKRLMPLSILTVGTGLTMTCASFGIAWLLMIASGPPPRAPTHGQMKTVLIRVEHLDVDEVAHFLKARTSEHGQVGANRSAHLVRITDLPWKLHHLKRVVRAIDRPLVPARAFGPIQSPGHISEPERGPIELPIGPAAR